LGFWLFGWLSWLWWLWIRLLGGFFWIRLRLSLAFWLRCLGFGFGWLFGWLSGFRWLSLIWVALGGFFWIRLRFHWLSGFWVAWFRGFGFGFFGFRGFGFGFHWLSGLGV